MEVINVAPHKVTFAAPQQQHFGAAMHSRAIPGSWSSTDNFLESSASATKDAIYTIDDYVTVGSSEMPPVSVPRRIGCCVHKAMQVGAGVSAPTPRSGEHDLHAD